MENLSNNFLGLTSLLIVPAVTFGLTLSYNFNNPPWYFTFSARVTWMILCCALLGIAFGTLLYRSITSIWTPWEIYKENQPYIKPVFNYAPELGGEKIGEDQVLVDIYVKTHKYSGLKKYKRVTKYR